jgi:hypothetical protein
MHPTDQTSTGWGPQTEEREKERTANRWKKSARAKGERGGGEGGSYASIVWRVTQEFRSAVPSCLDILCHRLVLRVKSSAVGEMSELREEEHRGEGTWQDRSHRQQGHSFH